MTHRVVLVCLLIVTSLSAAAPSSAASEPPTSEQPVAEEPVVVQFAPDVDAEERARALDAQGLELVDDGAGDFVLAEPTDDVDDADPPAPAPGDAPIVDIRPEVPMEAHAAPNDVAFPFQWHLRASQAAEAWDITTGTGTVVAVLDTGVAYRSAGLFTRAPDLARTSFTTGRDFVDDDHTPDDHNGHGTHVTGTIAQSTNNGIGGAGLAPGATIMPVRVLDAEGRGSDFRTAQGIRWAADNGADVINLSLGGRSSSAAMADAVRYAAARGVTMVASVGNDGGDGVYFPAAYPEVIAVGAVRHDRTLAHYSNRGPAVEVVAPGGDLNVDQDGDGRPDGILQETLAAGRTQSFCLCLYEGTSMAAPHVSAVAALLIAAGTDDPADIRSALRRSALDLGAPGPDASYGHGMVRARAALDAVGAVPREPFQPGVTARSIDRACPAVPTLPRDRFTDVAEADTHARPIDCMAWWSIANGVGATSYRPAASVTRGQMASFIARMISVAGHELPTAPADAFADDDRSTHEHRIDQLAAAGVIRGVSDRTFAPDAPVSRAALATFTMEAHALVAGETVATERDYFDDDGASPHQANINRAAEAGITTGTGSRTYDPGTALRRGQMASFLARTLDLLIADDHAVARA